MSDKTDYRFSLSAAEIDKISLMIGENLTAKKAEKRLILSVRLSVESLLERLLAKSAGEDGEFRMYRKFGKDYIAIRVKGEEPEGSIDDGFGSYSDRVLESIGLKPKIYHKAGVNYISIRLPGKERNPLVTIAIAAVIGLVLGIGAMTLAPSSLSVLSAIADPLSDTFLGLLSAVAGPVIFLSVAWGVICIGDAAILGTIGKKVILRIMSFMALFALCAVPVGIVCFRPVFDDASVDLTQLSVIYEMLLNILPDNMVAPFYDNNTLQIIVMAFAVGFAALILERKVSTFCELIDQVSSLMQLLMTAVIKLLPLFVFLCFFRMCISGNLSQMKTAWILVLLGVLFPVLMAAVTVLYASLRVKVPFGLLLKKLLPTFLLSVSTASSTASFGTNVHCCENSLGISKKLTQFGIPLGMVIYMPCMAAFFVMVGLYASAVCDVPVSFGWIVLCVISCVVLSLAAPPVPGGMLACFTILFAQLGIPNAAVGTVAVVGVIHDFFGTACNITILQCDMLIQASKMDLLDREALLSDK